MADDNQKGKERFRQSAERNRLRIEGLLRRSTRMGGDSVSGLDARGTLERLRSMDRTIPSEPAYVALVDSTVRANGWRYRARPSR